MNLWFIAAAPNPKFAIWGKEVMRQLHMYSYHHILVIVTSLVYLVLHAR